MEKKIKLGSRIVLGYGIILAFVLAIVAIAIFSLWQMNLKMKMIMDNAEKIKMVNTVRQSTLIVSKNTRGNIVFSNDPDTLSRIKEEIKAARAKSEKAIDFLKAATLTEKEKQEFENFVTNRSLSVPINNEVADLIAANKNNEAAFLLANQAEPMVQKSMDIQQTLADLVEADSKTANQSAIQTYSNSFKLLTFLVALCFVLGFLGAFFITRSITKPINNIVAGLNDSSHQVTAASLQLSASAQQLSESSAEQASSIEKTTSTLQESSSMLQQNTINTKQAAQLSMETSDSANSGSKDMQEMLDSIREIKKSSDQISKIIKVIDDIAFQTNILALNAAMRRPGLGTPVWGFRLWPKK